MSLFNRIANLTVGKEGTESGIFIKDLRITFKIIKTEKPESNTGSINIYNLSQNTRSEFEKDFFVILNAGYIEQSGVENLFIGNIETISNEKELVDINTNLECNDGSKFLKDTKINLSYKAGTSAKKILNDIIKSSPIAKQFINITDVDDQQFVNGFSYIGNFKTVMDNLSKKLSFEWSVQDNKLQVLKIDITNQKEAILLTPDSGLIGTPQKIELPNRDKTTDTATNKEKRPGYKVKSLLLPGATVGGLISVESLDIKKGSFFKIINIEHSGDTNGNEWNTTLEIEEKNR